MSEAAVDALYAQLYPELRRLAHAKLRGGGSGGDGGGLLDTTALVHESYERLVGPDGLRFADKSHFLAYAARAMRSLLVDAARERMAERHGGGAAHLALTTGLGERLAASDPAAAPELLRVHEALEALALIEPRLARNVELRYFGGLDNDEIAAVLAVSLRTVERDWERARSYLFALLK